jgi:DNA replication protein DnaC
MSKTWPTLKQKCSADFEWVCSDCGEVVTPQTTELDGNVYYRRRSFCPCPAGQKLAQAQVDADHNARNLARYKELLQGSGLTNGNYRRFRFDTWDVSRNVPSSEKAYNQVLSYTDNVLMDDKNWLYIFGDYGCGKTHLAVAAIRRILYKRLWTARVTVWPELCQATKETWGTNFGPSEAQLWARVRTARVLLIDDIDKTSTGEWAMGKLYALINYRLNKMLPTIITANDSLIDLREKWGESKQPHVHDLGLAVLSRIAEGLYRGVKIEGDDQRWLPQ